MNRKERIFSYINSTEYIPLTFDELAVMLDVPSEASEEFSEILDELILEGKIFLSKKKRYAPCEKNGILTGVLRCNPRGRFGFVSIENEVGSDVYIAPDDMSTAIDGDTVLVKLKKSSGEKREGIISSIIKRGNTTVSAVLTDDFIATCDNPRIFKPILLEILQDAKTGDRVLVEITEFANNGKLYGDVISVLGNSRELKSFVESIIHSNAIASVFPDEVLSSADSISDTVPSDELKDREDLRDRLIFTIDGEDARDFDDAVSLEFSDNGNYILGVHIADVSHYVTENSAIDTEAFRRGTSVYLADRVVPMLPEKLSNGICSLNPHEDRLTLSVFMEIDENGNVISHRICKSVIRSAYRMTYTEVAKILDGDSDLCKKYKEITVTLYKMNTLAKILLKKRSKRGSINFDFPESRIILSKNGLPESIVRIERNDAHRLIEEFMLITNETVAEFAFWADIPFVYRVHNEPDPEKMESFKRFIGSFGLNIKGIEVHPKDLQQILEKISGTENETIISTNMLRSLMKAEYKNVNEGHFGLAASYYCHFTSPIRRYPDLIIHRILKGFLDAKDIMHYADITDSIAAHSSDTERIAETAEREVCDLFKCAYIEGYVGKIFPATISSVTGFGIFAELENSIEGLIRLETISDDYYEYDEELRLIIGKRKHKIYRIGDRIEIEVARADLTTRQIDFVLKGSRVKKPAAKPKSSRNMQKFVAKKYKRKRK